MNRYRGEVYGIFNSRSDYEDQIDRDRARRRANAERRGLRVATARAKGTHTVTEWSILMDIFGRCVSCGIPYTDLRGGEPTKDHIIPIFAEGCDCIANIQPMCRNCNSQRNFLGDLRETARPDWVATYLSELERRFGPSQGGGEA